MVHTWAYKLHSGKVGIVAHEACMKHVYNGTVSKVANEAWREMYIMGK